MSFPSIVQLKDSKMEIMNSADRCWVFLENVEIIIQRRTVEFQPWLARLEWKKFRRSTRHRVRSHQFDGVIWSIHFCLRDHHRALILVELEFTSLPTVWLEKSRTPRLCRHSGDAVNRKRNLIHALALRASDSIEFICSVYAVHDAPFNVQATTHIIHRYVCALLAQSRS